MRGFETKGALSGFIRVCGERLTIIVVPFMVVYSMIADGKESDDSLIEVEFTIISSSNF